MKLDFSHRSMDVGTFAFNFMRTLMVAATGGAEMNECFLAAERIADDDQESWTREWAEIAGRLRRGADEAIAAARTVTARRAYLRASNYYRAAMSPLAHTDPRLEAYLTSSRESFHEAARRSSPAIEVVDIPFGGARLPAYFLAAGPPRRPTLVALNGGDSTNEEMVHWVGFAARARGWNCLVFEGPGQWSAMQLNPGLRLRPDYEAPVGAALDYLARRGEVDPDAIALFGPSLGSTLAARAAAFEPRVRACICDGLVVDVHEAWRAVWPTVLQKAPPAAFDAVFGLLERVSPQLRGLSNHFRWMLDVSKPHELIDAWKPYSIKGLAPRVRCPMLMIYGEAEAAQSSEAVALDALRFVRDLSGPAAVRVFGFDEGWAASHCQIGALAAMQALVFDWLERAVGDGARLPRRDLDANVREILPRYVHSRAAKEEVEALLNEMR